jgi:hypothetical protein
MSNILNNTTSLQNILEALQNKATSGGEDVTNETSTYTEKLEQLTTAVTALEIELEGKAGGDSEQFYSITNNGYVDVNYINHNHVLSIIPVGATVEALDGIILFAGGNIVTITKGEAMISGGDANSAWTKLVKFNSDGEFTISGAGGGTN